MLYGLLILWSIPTLHVFERDQLRQSQSLACHASIKPARPLTLTWCDLKPQNLQFKESTVEDRVFPTSESLGRNEQKHWQHIDKLIDKVLDKLGWAWPSFHAWLLQVAGAGGAGGVGRMWPDLVGALAFRSFRFIYSMKVRRLDEVWWSLMKCMIKLRSWSIAHSSCQLCFTSTQTNWNCLRKSKSKKWKAQGSEVKRCGVYRHVSFDTDMWSHTVKTVKLLFRLIFSLFVMMLNSLSGWPGAMRSRLRFEF